MRIKTFPKGGVHPPENKIAASAAIRDFSIPEIVTLFMNQHLGAPAEPVVQKGDRVRVGDLVAKSGGFVSAPVHAPVSGVVRKVEPLPDQAGYKKMAVVLETEGDEWIDAIDRTTDLVTNTNLTGEEIIQRVSEMGIVGLGGATFPTHVKLKIPPGRKAEVLIINGVECEPYLTADYRLMLEKGEEILVGTKLLMKALQVDRALVGIENNKPEAIDHLSKLAKKYPGIQVAALRVKYPQGGEKQLIKALTGREVPSGKLPVDVGAVVQNTGTAFAVYEAVMKHKPLIERIVTITGKGMAQPSNFRVRLGTSLAQLVDAAGGLPENTGKIINGGPMMGKAIANLDTPVTKGTSGLVILPADESQRKPVLPCIRCSKCITVCPMGLEPYLLMTLGELKRWEEMENHGVQDCIECGSCSFVCPAHRPLLDFIRLGKANVNRLIRSRNK